MSAPMPEEAASYLADEPEVQRAVESIDRAGDRSWNYVTLGLGHPLGATFWADVVYTLRSVGYDGTLNIEHEDTLVNSVEGVGRAAALLKQVVLVEQPDWKPASI